MPFNLSIPISNSSIPLIYDLNVGETIFILGANGVGKSSLMYHLFFAHHNFARRISAHRQTWFSSNTMNMTAENKRNTERNILNSDNTPQSRWKEDHSEQRTSMAIYDLIDAENVRARAIAGAVEQNNINLAQQLAKKDAPIKTINELLRLSNLPIEISVKENEQVMASKSGGPLYSIAELSDGERNALLVAAGVLTAKNGTLILIDEPERHLHRSIISPLLTLLFARRPDCAFVISTHDTMLPLDNPNSKTLLIRNCTYSAANVIAWDADLVPANVDIGDELRRDILGARRKILFVEGTEQSLDKPLYSLIFPNVSIIPKSSCRDVTYAVSGIRSATNLHWVYACGIIDNDGRPSSEVKRLEAKGIYPLSVWSVEAIYY